MSQVRGQLCYFGGWGDPEAALEAYNRQRDDLHAGRKPREMSKGVEVRHVLNEFWNAKKALVESRELSPRTLRDYEAVADLIVEGFGKNRMAADLGPDDFAELRKRMTAKGWGTLRLRDYIQRVRCVFKFAYEARLIAAPMIFGPGFARPTRKAMRLERAKKGARMFEAAEIRQMLNAAGQPLKAMILLGINCGFGNADCGRLPIDSVDLVGGWLTTIGRRRASSPLPFVERDGRGLEGSARQSACAEGWRLGRPCLHHAKRRRLAQGRSGR